MSVKIDRIASSIMKEVSYILSTEIKDNHIKFVTVTDCRVTSDLSFAKIYVTILDETKKEEILKSLKNASGYIRKTLAHRLEIRHIPELIFVYDESISYGKNIENIIDKINKKN